MRSGPRCFPTERPAHTPPDVNGDPVTIALPTSDRRTAARGVVLPWTDTFEPQTFLECGLPTWRHGWVPRRLGLATRRQLREQLLAPGGQSPCARVVWGPRSPRDRRVRWAYLYRVDLAAPSVPNTPARELARQAAMLRRRTCDVPGHVGPRDVGYCVPKISLGGCVTCWAAGRCLGTQGPCEEAA